MARIGVMMSLTRAVTTAPKAAPITTAMARSTTLPRRTNVLNSLRLSFTALPPGPASGRPAHLGPLREVPAGIRRNTRGRTDRVGGVTVRGRRGWAAVLLAGVAGVATVGPVLWLTAAPAGAFTASVTINDKPKPDPKGAGVFNQPVTQIHVNDRVIWTNKTQNKHTVTSDPGSLSFDSGDIPGGGEYELRFSTAGTYTYHCTIHPSMVGRIEVTDPSATTTTTAPPPPPTTTTAPAPPPPTAPPAPPAGRRPAAAPGGAQLGAGAYAAGIVVDDDPPEHDDDHGARGDDHVGAPGAGRGRGGGPAVVRAGLSAGHRRAERLRQRRQDPGRRRAAGRLRRSPRRHGDGAGRRPRCGRALRPLDPDPVPPRQHLIRT